MAFVHGKDSVFKLDNNSGSLTDISAYVNNVDFPELGLPIIPILKLFKLIHIWALIWQINILGNVWN